MPIPNIADFQDALSKIRTYRKRPSVGGAAKQLPLLAAIDETGHLSLESLWLWYSEQTKMSFDSLVNRIGKELAESRHPRSDQFSMLMLAFSRLLPTNSGTVVERLNRVLELVCDADVCLYFVAAPPFPDQYQFEIPPFRFGRLRSNKLKYNCERARSDYYERYRETLRDCWAAEREHKTVRVLNIPRLRDAVFSAQALGQQRSSWEEQAWESLVNGYFSLQTRFLFDRFWEELEITQDPLISLGAPYVETATMRNVVQNQQIAVFLNIGPGAEGFVSPIWTGALSMDLANGHVRVPDLLRELKEEYGFEKFDNTPLHNSIKLYASFVASARKHQLSGRLDEALLHFVIVLELIFGERQAIQRSVSERVALTTWTLLLMSFYGQPDWR